MTAPTSEGTVGRLSLVTYPYDGHCLMCKWGYPVLFGNDEPLETWACGMHTVHGIKSKRLTAPTIDRKRYGLGRAYAPLMVWDESCEGFRFVERDSRKWRYLEACGLLDKEVD